ncbi:MAG: succinate dehydrogenase cytochrome b558 subunit [Planctomycetales bacterium]|nr:succinate dehydrogenase cytochrome b558 subunit [Planctomycetales bacterium]
MNTSESFMGRHEFLIRRLHSLSGLVPVGAYMVVHLTTNASVLNSSGMFQALVHRIHSLGFILPVVEWGFIFLPILFHAIFGFVIIRGGSPNHSTYSTGSNLRYTLQRASGVLAFFFIMWHVFHMHGWFHFEPWLEMAHGMNGAQFKPFNAASSLNRAMAGTFIPALYFIGLGSCVFHLANGIWTMGITWGVWTSPKAQARASWICLVFGIGLMGVGMSALAGAKSVDLKEALEVEQRAVDIRLETGEITEHAVEEKSYSETERAEVLEAAAKQDSDQESTEAETAAAASE